MSTTIAIIEPATLQQLVDNFLTCTMVCMANAIYNIDYCYAIFLRSSRILQLTSNKVKFQSTYNATRLKYANTKITNYADYLLNNMQQAQDIWKDQYPQYDKFTRNVYIENVKEKIKDDGNIAGWPITDATYIWQWLHIIAVHLDCNAGFNEKIAFINFIPNIVTCTICKMHYVSHKDELLNSLKITSCANVLLALHTFINETQKLDEDKKFNYSNILVKIYFHSKYKRDYLRLLTANDNKSIM